MTLTRALPATVWRPLFRVGSVAARLFVLFYIAALVLYFVSPPPVSGGAATLTFIAGNKPSYIAQQLLWLLPSLFALIVFTAVFLAVLPKSPVLAVLGFVIGAASWMALLAVPVTSEGTLSLVFLSDQYTAATGAARAPFVAAAEALIAQNNTVSLAGALTPLGLLVLSMALVHGGVGRWAGWIGVATGALGLLSEALRFTVPGMYAVYGPMLWLWFMVIAFVLFRLSRAPAGSHERDRKRGANVRGSVVIDRPVADVFAVVADQRNEPRFNPRMRSVEKVTSGPIGGGTRWLISTGTKSRLTRFELEFTDFEPPTRLGSHTRMSALDIDGELTLTPTPVGTQLTWSWTLTPNGLLRLATPVIVAVGRRQEHRIWTDLKTYLESDPESGTVPPSGLTASARA